jgi:hypothetical protein
VILAEIEQESVPDDLFSLIKVASHFVNEMTVDELRQVVQRSMKYMPNPSFWSQLLVVH